mmetsp:Transcript_4669/g.8812  ORF Transcript_4669/g.8812 Transcript_4669/m.8812 type:complete len:215 (-) Transcript_4669:1131-1775(-)
MVREVGPPARSGCEELQLLRGGLQRSPQGALHLAGQRRHFLLHASLCSLRLGPQGVAGGGQGSAALRRRLLLRGLHQARPRGLCPRSVLRGCGAQGLDASRHSLYVCGALLEGGVNSSRGARSAGLDQPQSRGVVLGHHVGQGGVGAHKGGGEGRGRGGHLRREAVIHLGQSRGRSLCGSLQRRVIGGPALRLLDSQAGVMLGQCGQVAGQSLL